MKTSRIVFAAALGVTLSVAAVAETIDGKEVKRYEGTVQSVGGGKIVVQTASSTGNWKVGSKTVVMFGAQRLPVPDAEGGKVVAFVSEDGYVHRLDLLQRRPADGEPDTAPDVGEIVSVDTADGKIEIKMPNSTGHWKIGAFTHVRSGDVELPLTELQPGRKVRVSVEKSGKIDRVDLQ
jgi:hypothetical protein